jgi:hypothetical protein
MTGLLFFLLRLISLAASADLTAVGDPTPNLTALAAFDHSLLSIIHLSELVFCFPVIFTVAINDKHSLCLFTEFANSRFHNCGINYSPDLRTTGLLQCAQVYFCNSEKSG